ncbi:MAG: hypothetical protein LBT41_02390 [Candidatus Methanoplasma sp.]|jgi:hypothetical protein|nr:hypothetical protein [Candidatus Methanoplasma sp.]
MDGNIKNQVTLMRAVIGRKTMEIDAFEEKAASATGEEAEKYLNMIDFLKSDIFGYKSVIVDFRDGSCDFTANLWDVANLPEESLGLYTNYYLPGLAPDEREEETTAMGVKVAYAEELKRAFVLFIGRSALTDPRALDIILANEKLVTLIGEEVIANPELMNVLEKQ